MRRAVEERGMRSTMEKRRMHSSMEKRRIRSTGKRDAAWRMTVMITG